MGHRIIVENHSISHFIGNLLDHSGILGRHTSVIHLAKLENDVRTMTKYVWTNDAVCPWGETLPAQCGTCRSFRPWGKPKRQGQDDEVIVFTCNGLTKSGRQCGAIRRYTPPVGHAQVSGTSPWIKFAWE